jgi:hypothetical protein
MSRRSWRQLTAGVRPPAGPRVGNGQEVNTRISVHLPCEAARLTDPSWGNGHVGPHHQLSEMERHEAGALLLSHLYFPRTDLDRAARDLHYLGWSVQASTPRWRNSPRKHVAGVRSGSIFVLGGPPESGLRAAMLTAAKRVAPSASALQSTISPELRRCRRGVQIPPSESRLSATYSGVISPAAMAGPPDN